MRKLLILGCLYTGMAWSQTTPSSLLITRIFNITNTWPGECAAGVIDNRSMYTRQNNYHSFFATGTGTWSVTMEFSDTSCAGPFTSYGPQAVINQASSPQIGYGTDGAAYHQFVTFVFSGANANTVTVTYSAVQNFFLSTSVGALTFPLTVPQGGTGFGSCTSNGFIFGNGTGALQCLTAGSQYQVAQAGSGGAPAMGAVQLAQAAAVAGQLGAANGGTGDSTLTLNGFVFGNGTSPAGITAAGSQYQVAQAGASGVPTVGPVQLAQAAAVAGQLPVGNGGTGVSVAQGNGSKVQLSTGTTTTGDCANYDANGNVKDAGGPCFAPPAGLQTQFLRIQPNTGNNITLQFAYLATVTAADYNFPAQTPGGSLSIGSNTVTLSPCPDGVAGSDTNHSLYIQGGTGGAEPVPITGGTCTSGASSGTVIITAANTHTGAWTVSSATLGGQEANNINAGSLPLLFTVGGSIYSAITITNPGTQVLCSLGVTLTWAGASGGSTTMFSIATNNISIQNCSISGGAAQSAIANSGTRTGLRIDNNQLSGSNWPILIGLGTDIVITRNHISGYTNGGILLSNIAVQYVRVANNFVDGTASTAANACAICLEGSHSVVEGNNLIIGANSDVGINFLSSLGLGLTDITIANNTVYVTGASAFEPIGIAYVDRFAITGNTVKTSATLTGGVIGIEINRSNNGTVSGNTVDLNNPTVSSPTEIILESSSNVNVSGNVLSGWGSGATSSAIYLVLTVAATNLSYNTIANNTLNNGSAGNNYGDIIMNSQFTGNITMNVFEGNVIESVQHGTLHVCFNIANSAGATSTLHRFVGNTCDNTDTGFLLGSGHTNMFVDGNRVTNFTTAIYNDSATNTKIVDGMSGTATAVAGSVNLNYLNGTVTSESLTTAAGATYTLALHNTALTANSIITANTFLGSSTQGTPQIVSVTPGASLATIVVKNIHATLAFNGTIVIQYQASHN